MKFELLKEKNNKSKWIIGGFATLSIISIGALAFSYAKYRNVESVKLAEGTVNYRVPDLNLVAMYQENNSGGWDAISAAPTSGYTLNTTSSVCNVNGTKDAAVTISYASGKVTIANLTKRGTKCYLYFDKIKDTTKPTISNVATSVTKTEINVTVTASDNVGVTEYWYAIDSGSFTKGTGNTHKFTGLTAGSSHTIKVYVKDAAGNQSDTSSKNVTTTPNNVTLVSAGGKEVYSYHIWNYSVDGTTWKTLYANAESWTIPIGAKIRSDNCTLLYICSTADCTDDVNYSGYISHLPKTSSTNFVYYTITGNEKSFYHVGPCLTEENIILVYDEKKKKKLKKKVKDLKVGDKVYSYDEKQDKIICTEIKKIEISQVLEVCAIRLENGEKIRCTVNHKFYVAGAGYMPASMLKKGAEILGVDGINYKVEEVVIESHSEGIDIYSIELADGHNCFISNLKVLTFVATFMLSYNAAKQSVEAACDPCVE